MSSSESTLSKPEDADQETPPEKKEGTSRTPGKESSTILDNKLDTYEQIDPAISILIAERSPLHLPKFKEMFADFRLKNLTITGNGYKAITYGRENKYGLIFVGQPLSNVDGINTIEALRADGLNTDTPIIFSWEGVEKTLLQRASSIGATGFLQKPIEEVHFRRLFEIVLNKYIVSFDDERERAHEAMKPMVQATEFAKNIRLQGDYEAAETAFKKGLVELFCGLAEVYLSGGNPSYANRVLAQAERIDPNARTRFDVREETFIERGRNYIEKKWHDGAKVEFEAALSLNENSIPALIGLGEACQLMGKSEEANEIYERILQAKVMPEDRPLFSQFGTLALRNKNFEVASTAFDKAISYFPQDAINYYNKSLIYVLQKQWDKVIPLLKKALSIKPGFEEASSMLQKAQKWNNQSSVKA